MIKTFARARFLAVPLLAGLLFMGAGCGGGSSTAQTEATTPVTINVWGVFDTADAWQPIFSAYSKLHPNVSFNYRELRSDEYQTQLLQGFAQGTGPDIFAVHNTGLGQDLVYLSPMPKTVTVAYSTITGTINKQTTYTLKTTPTITANQLQNQYVDVVSNDVVENGSIYGLPLSVDTLVMFYNRDLLDTANIAQPPTTWDEFQKTDIPKLTTLGANDTILQSGAAIGTSQNVERAFDILSLLMMQNGTAMTDSNGHATFAGGDVQQGQSPPGISALQFYSDFANPATAAYTWNAKEPPSFTAFANGQTAFFFGYSYHIPLLRAQNPKLRFGIAPVPQIQGAQAVNYANYWVEGVAKSSKNQNWDWDFIQFAASAAQAPTYLKAADHPPALKSLIANYLTDPDLGPFANELLTAKSWYHGNNPDVTEQAFLDLIDAANAGSDLSNAMQTAETKVNQTL